MNTNIFLLSPFCTPREKVTFPRYAILLNEEEKESSRKVEEPLSARVSSLAEEILPKHSPQEDPEDIVGRVGAILQDRIKDHSGEDAVLFTADEVKKKNSPALVPLMYRIATEDFVKSSKSLFKIIECRNSTKLVSDWKPTLPDVLIGLKHQVIIVQLKETFLPYNDFVYAVLRQLDHEWKLRIPRSFFYPNDVCKVESTQDRDLIVVTPSMPDGDLEISRKMSTLNYELIMMFKRSCMSAMKNYLLMRDLRVGKFQDTVDAVATIRSIYKKLQDRLREGQEIRLGSGSNEDVHNLLQQSLAGPLSADILLEYGKKLGIDDEILKGSGSDDSQKVEDKFSIKSILNETGAESESTENIKESGIGVHKSVSRAGTEIRSGRSTAKEPILNTDYSVLDEKLCAEFNRIQLLISGESENKLEFTEDEMKDKKEY